MTGPRRLACVLLLAWPLTGCVRADRRIANAALRLGMTREEVSASWGPPASKTRASSDLGENESWIYADGRSVEFDGGVLKSFEDPASPAAP